MKMIQGGVCAAKGFRANGVHCGIRHNRVKRDLALIVSDVPATAAAVYTRNLVKGAPLTVTAAPVCVREGDTVAVGDLRFEVWHTPGHTVGSVCFAADGVRSHLASRFD